MALAAFVRLLWQAQHLADLGEMGPELVAVLARASSQLDVVDEALLGAEQPSNAAAFVIAGALRAHLDYLHLLLAGGQVH